MEARQTAAAIAHFKAALDVHPNIEQYKRSYAYALYSQANSQIEQGRRDAAISSYHRALEILPDLAEAYSNLGNCQVEQGRHDDAIANCQRALAIRPDYAEAYNNRGNAQRRVRQFDNAVISYQRALQIKPDLATAHSNFGDLFRDHGQSANAVASCRRALAVEPDYAAAHSNLGDALTDLRQLDNAVASYLRALKIKPDLANAHNNLCIALIAHGRLDTAVASCHRSIAISPECAEAHCHLGDALRELKQLDNAVASYRRALEIRPDFVNAHSNLGFALLDLGQLDGAAASYRLTLDMKPDCAEAHSNLGVVLRGQGQLHDAMASYQRALKARPDFTDADYRLGNLLLLMGCFDEGWLRYESRYDPRTLKRTAIPPVTTVPQWRGESLLGKTLLFWCEQGLGDQIQFCRYLSILRRQGARRITLVCAPALESLLKRCSGADEVLTSIDAERVSDHDYWTFPLSVPLHCSTTLKSIPASIPYLSADAELEEDIRARLANVLDYKVGICWQGAKGYVNDAERSPGLEPFRQLFRVTSARFFTLLPHGRDAFLLAASSAAFDLGHEIDFLTPPFEETAALIMNLDLVITSDTSIAHLAGALGKPVWVVLPFVPDWRWMMDREDSPWYPSMRLFRQRRRGDWIDVFEHVARRLESVIAGESPVLSPIPGLEAAISANRSLPIPLSRGRYQS